MNIQIDKEVAFTSEWWVNILKDEPRLIAWLRKLYGTEIGGFQDYEKFKLKFADQIDARTETIFDNIGKDELKHGGLIESLLLGRNRSLDRFPPPSEYWLEMDSHIIDLNTACAVNYYGEALAAFRFEVLVEHPDTPSDIREMLRIILPDEQFHRTTLKKLAGDETLAKFEAIHNAAMERLKTK